MHPAIIIIFGAIFALGFLAIIGGCIYEIRNVVSRRRDRNLTRRLISNG